MMFAMPDDFDGGKPFDAAYAATRAEVGAALRGHPDEGRRRDPPAALARGRVRRLRDLGHRQPRRRAGQDPGHAARRVRPLGRCSAACSSRRSSASTRSSSAWSAPPTPTPASRARTTTTSSASSPPTSRRRTGSLNADGSIHMSKGGADRHHAGELAVHHRRPHRGLGHREHPRRALRRDGAPGGLRHHRPAHPPALLRRLGLRARGRRPPRPRPDRLRQGRADGRRPAAGARGRHRADLPRLRAARPDRRQPRPPPDRQGLARRRGRSAGAGLRRRLVRRPHARRRRQAAARRRHRRPRDPDLDQHHRRRRARRRLAGPRLRSRPARLLLRPRHRDPDPALDRLRRGQVRSRPAARGAAQDPGARLFLADLVYARG